MHRKPLLELLGRYLARHPDEHASVGRMRRFVETHADCFERSCREAHVTASAWIVSADHTQVLLTHHRKLGLWLQLGGHADGEPNPLRVAIAEAREESGMDAFTQVGPGPLDVDVHQIPPYGKDPPHFHHDVCFLLEAAPGQPLVRSPESNDLAWVSWEEAARTVHETSLRRKARKARARLGLDITDLA